MSPLYLHNNKLLVVGGKLAVNEACCCEEPPSSSSSSSNSSSPECICPTDCVPGLFISLGGNPTCGDGYYFDSINCDNGTIDASMTCNNGVWNVAVVLFCEVDGDFCFSQYEADLQCENDNLPPAGNVNLILTNSAPPNCFLAPPVVTITKS